MSKTQDVRVNPNQRQLLPTPLNHILDPEIELTAHNHGMRLACQLIQVRDPDTVDLVVHVQALDVLPVVFHDCVDEVVYGGVFVADEDLAVEHLVVFEDVVEHFLVEVLGRRREVDFHAAGFFGLEVDVAVEWLVSCFHIFDGLRVGYDGVNELVHCTHGGSRFNLIPTASNSASSSLLCSAFFVASRIMQIKSLVFAAEITCLPRPFPSAAPSMIPGKSSTWISAPPYSSTPGIAVKVVKE
jgi:hypothetical protein